MIDSPAYIEKVYSGVLGKIIGVYMGRPVEGWSHKKIQKEIGDIWYYVHDKIGVPLIVTDDDISGTFTFIRALEDSPGQKIPDGKDVAHAWLNYIIENRTILWWGGKGISTEHTAYLALKEGVEPPESGSIERNGKIVAEQIGAQIFIDGWAMVAPGDPDFAVSLASAAAHVSHDREAVYGAMVIAAMEALAFVCDGTEDILKKALSYIPDDSVIYCMNSYLIELHHREPDWRKAWSEFSSMYNYEKYPGFCHIVPNHGLVVLSLLYGDDDFQKSQMIVNTCGWDTDCNAANVGCFLGIKNGLAGIDAGADFRTPVRDRLYLATADGGRAISDALTVAYQLINAARKLKGLPGLAPKQGARFHFSQPGSVQGFHYEDPSGEAPQPLLDNYVDTSVSEEHLLRCTYRNLSRGQHLRLKTATFIPPEAREMPGYEFIASPTLYSGQTITARCYVKDTTGYIEAALFTQVNGDDDNLLTRHGKKMALEPGRWYTLSFTVNETGGQPITFVGIELISPCGGSHGTLYLDYLTWDDCVTYEMLPLQKPKGKVWMRAWVDSVDMADFHWNPGVRISKDPGLGLLYQGTETWHNYHIKATILPHLFRKGGIACAIRGLRNYLMVYLDHEKQAKLAMNVDGDIDILASAPFDFQWEKHVDIEVNMRNGIIEATFDGSTMLKAECDERLLYGAAGFLVESGSLSCLQMTIES
ncbi:ADP-ribosylglycohydrolase family protein [Sediminispirochaeta bajacaliforniensis]|uniref:ADP-ribosylglycohydrolase family protein n=1 Tax=Sediminispirochaeta bajacaliforniensis TaxID=148 RepID=UPI0009D99E9E|nr:ADP-ribosylglycohydrolase family protein [Sediminispirochaeta bajacaliforniensis]